MENKTTFKTLDEANKFVFKENTKYKIFVGGKQMCDFILEENITLLRWSEYLTKDNNLILLTLVKTMTENIKAVEILEKTLGRTNE